jgi:hypothetical protein
MERKRNVMTFISKVKGIFSKPKPKDDDLGDLPDFRIEQPSLEELQKRIKYCAQSALEHQFFLDEFKGHGDYTSDFVVTAKKHIEKYRKEGEKWLLAYQEEVKKQSGEKDGETIYLPIVVAGE